MLTQGYYSGWNTTNVLFELSRYGGLSATVRCADREVSHDTEDKDL